MKIVFMGTPEFSAVILSALAQTEHSIGYAVSQPDKARDRGKKVQPTPVRRTAEEYGIPVLQPEKVKGNSEFIEALKEYGPDLIIVAAYGKLLPKEILELPPLGCINIHASLLPRHRGAAPIQRAIIEGDEKTGITLMQMEEKMDTGGMFAKRETFIGNKNSEELHDELAQMGGALLIEKLKDIETGRLKAEAQDHSQATYAPMIFKKDGEIDFTKSAAEIERLIRGLNPWPGAYSYMNGELFKIWKAMADERKVSAPPGTIIGAGSSGIEIVTGNGVLTALVIQTPGKKRISAGDYIRGNKLDIGTRLGE